MASTGNLDNVSIQPIAGVARVTVTGWARSEPPLIGRPILEIFVDEARVGSVIGYTQRPDLVYSGFEDGRYGFKFIVPQDHNDGNTHLIRVKIKGAATFLIDAQKRGVNVWFPISSGSDAEPSINRERTYYTSSVEVMAGVIEGTTQCVAVAPPKFGPSLARNPLAFTFTLPAATAQIDYYMMTGAILDAQTGAVFVGDRKHRSTGYSMIPSSKLELKYNKVIQISDNNIIVIAFHAWYRNYYHWLTQCLPSMALAKEQLGIREISFALPPLTTWQLRLMEIFGLSEVPRIDLESAEQYQLERLFFSTVSQGVTVNKKSLRVREIFDRFRSNEENDYCGPIVYVSRADAKARRMTNEPELEAELIRHGAVVTRLTEMSVDEQIATFAEASIIIGPHGAGFSNIVFCHQQTFILELISSRRLNPCFANLAQAMDLQYRAESFDVWSQVDDSDFEWRVEVDRVSAVLGDIKLALINRLSKTFDGKLQRWTAPHLKE